MFVYIEVLDASESLAGLGSDPRDKIVLHAGPPPSPRSHPKGVVPEGTIVAPIIGQPTGVVLPLKLANDIKHELQKSVNWRALDAFTLRLNITKNGHWVGTIYVRLPCLLHGHVLERWLYMRPIKGSPLGMIKVRIVLRESEDEALAVQRQRGDIVEPSDLTRTDGCDCDLCDPYHEFLDEATKRRRIEVNSREYDGGTCAIS